VRDQLLRSGSSHPGAYSPGESIVENCSLVHWELVARLRDFMFDMLLVTLEGKWANRRNFEQRRGTLPWCDRCVGNEGLWASCSNEHLGLRNSIEI
jgi:hypothetical protein